MKEIENLSLICNKTNWTSFGWVLAAHTCRDDFLITDYHILDDNWLTWKKKRIYEWDDLHWEIELYDSNWKHLWVLNPNWKYIKDAVPWRTVKE